MNSQVKEAPHSKENEMMVLGCMLNNPNSLMIAAEGLNDSDFYFTEHKILFCALKLAQKNNRPTDIHLICEDLKRQGKLESAGGVIKITELSQYAGTSAYVEEYIDYLKMYTQRRHLLFISQDIQRQALEGGNPSEIITKAQEEFNLNERNRGSKDRFSIKFLNEFDTNFLIDIPPKKPMILEYANDKGIPAGFLPKGIVAMLVGAGGVGKTHLLAQLAISVSTGTPWLDTITTTEHCGEGKRGNVFFGLGENQYEDIHRVLYKASQKLRKHQPDLTLEDLLIEAAKKIAPFSFCGQQAAFIEDKKPSLYFKQLKAKLIETAPKDGWSLIILDPVSRLMGADAETDNAAATQFISLLEELTIDLPGNPTILFAHHVSKSAINETNQNQTAARGSSALTDGVRQQFNLSKNDKEELILKMTKSNFTAIPDQICIKKDSNGYLENSTYNLSVSNSQSTKNKLFG